jgi:putative sterol carrier protein
LPFAQGYTICIDTDGGVDAVKPIDSIPDADLAIVEDIRGPLTLSRRARTFAAMAHPFPSPEWAAEFKTAIERSVAYKAAGATWTHGAVAMVVKADPSIGIPEDIGLWLDLDRGVCRDARVVGKDEAQKAPFCITGDYARWKQVIRKELDPIKGMMQKKLELKGQMTIIVKYVNASKELVECATQVPTTFLDEK